MRPFCHFSGFVMVNSTIAASASEALDDVTEQASSTLDKLREQTDAVVQRVRPQLDVVANYARDEPTKALLISAATGAALMGLVALMSRSSGPRLPDSRDLRALKNEARDSGSSLLATLRDAALDLADRAHGAGKDALDTAHKYVDSKQSQATDATDSAVSKVSDTVTDAWKTLRDQASEKVDKLRPPLDAAAGYAKDAAGYARDEPARVALGVAAVGAVVIGLLALIRGSDSDY